jgi:hypothetical protein
VGLKYERNLGAYLLCHLFHFDILPHRLIVQVDLSRFRGSSRFPRNKAAALKLPPSNLRLDSKNSSEKPSGGGESVSIGRLDRRCPYVTAIGIKPHLASGHRDGRASEALQWIFLVKHAALLSRFVATVIDPNPQNSIGIVIKDEIPCIINSSEE